jgi:hypothetical protein
MVGQIQSLADLPQEKRPHYTLGRRLDGPQSRSIRGGEKKKQPLPAIEPLVTILTEIPWSPILHRETDSFQQPIESSVVIGAERNHDHFRATSHLIQLKQRL